MAPGIGQPGRKDRPAWSEAWVCTRMPTECPQMGLVASMPEHLYARQPCAKSVTTVSQREHSAWEHVGKRAGAWSWRLWRSSFRQVRTLTFAPPPSQPTSALACLHWPRPCVGSSQRESSKATAPFVSQSYAATLRSSSDISTNHSSASQLWAWRSTRPRQRREEPAFSRTCHSIPSAGSDSRMDEASHGTTIGCARYPGASIVPAGGSRWSLMDRPLGLKVNCCASERRHGGLGSSWVCRSSWSRCCFTYDGDRQCARQQSRSASSPPQA